MSATATTLAALRTAIARIEAGAAPQGEAYDDEHDNGSLVPLGVEEADEALRGGLRRGALHEVFAGDASHGGTACGFAVGLSLRVAPRRKPIVWIRPDFASREGGRAFAPGLEELGLSPDRLVLVRVRDGSSALRAAADALTCAALGAVILDLWGPLRALDLPASRRLALAAARSGVTALALRTGAEPEPSAAATRWTLRAARSPGFDDWGPPVFDAALVRNRHGRNGRWTMQWDPDAGLFRTPPPAWRPLVDAPKAPRPAPPAALHRPDRAEGGLRRAG